MKESLKTELSPYEVCGIYKRVSLEQKRLETYSGKRCHLHSLSDGMLTVTESDLIRYGIVGGNVIECFNDYSN